MVTVKAGQAMVATRLGGAHEHRTRRNLRIASCCPPCAAVSRVGPSVWNMSSNPWCSRLLSSSRSRLERQLLGDASLNTEAKAGLWLVSSLCSASHTALPLVLEAKPSLIYIIICHWTHSTLPHARPGPQCCQCTWHLGGFSEYFWMNEQVDQSLHSTSGYFRKNSRWQLLRIMCPFQATSHICLLTSGR